MYVETTATLKIKQLSKRIRGIAGGTSASKTISAILYLIALAQTDPNPTLTSIVSESFPHLKRGAMRDFLNIMNQQNYYREDRWNRSDFIYQFETGSRIEFFSADQPGKVRGPRRDRLFVNEANNIPYETWDQLVIRTKDFAMADWNPTNEFWFYTDVLNQRDDVDFITLTYKDNEALDEQVVKEIESHRHNKNWWLVYGLGQLGEIESRIYTGWTILDDIPDSARLERRGLDFGYSVDPTAIIDVYYLDGGFILDERIYRKGMSNKDIADWLKAYDDNYIKVYADSAEPKSIDEISTYGINIIPAQKGPGSVSQGIQYIQDQRISITKRSVNLIREYRNYLWETDKDGKYTGQPEDINDHGMDAIRYALESYSRNYSRDVGIVTAGVKPIEPKSWVADEEGVPLAYAYNLEEAVVKNTDKGGRDWQVN